MKHQEGIKLRGGGSRESVTRSLLAQLRIDGENSELPGMFSNGREGNWEDESWMNIVFCFVLKDGECPCLWVWLKGTRDQRMGVEDHPVMDTSFLFLKKY